jgi:hypothetical protein
MESLELFGTKVLPEFMDRDEQQQRDKAQHLAPAIDAALARKPADDHPPLPADDYEFPAIPRGLADRAGGDAFHQWLDDFAGKTALGGGGEFNDLLG